ncbi:hypothetical protein D6833_12415 [Candidatus Parcubacteria bacterium]|nr:MAG: hypothetical protein D6833_12415 [Candidatus Parcubacteria bacterium]
MHVYDAFGNEVWSTHLGPSSEPVAVTYGGPTLEEGMFYQFKAYSCCDKSGQKTYISTTEDLKGVFFYEPTPCSPTGRQV